MTTESSLLEDDGGAAPSVSATSNLTAGVKNPVPPLGTVVTRKKRKSVEELEEEIEEYIAEAFKRPWVHIPGISPEYSTSKHPFYDDAQRAKNQGQTLRYHESMKNYYKQLSVDAAAKGDKVEADKFAASAKTHEDKAKAFDAVAFKHDLKSPQPMRKPPSTGRRVGELRAYFDVPFSRKDEAKKMGMRWDPQKKMWFIDEMSWGKDEIKKIPFKRKSAFPPL